MLLSRIPLPSVAALADFFCFHLGGHPETVDRKQSQSTKQTYTARWPPGLSRKPWATNVSVLAAYFTDRLIILLPTYLPTHLPVINSVDRQKADYSGICKTSTQLTGPFHIFCPRSYLSTHHSHHEPDRSSQQTKNKLTNMTKIANNQVRTPGAALTSHTSTDFLLFRIRNSHNREYRTNNNIADS